MAVYDIAIIGKGLMGCAALRHLTRQHPALKVCIIGPDEPPVRKTHSGVFASHYDQGRITRVLDPSPLWGRLAQRSMAQYPAIEADSGLRFHHAVGCLRVSDSPPHAAAVDDCAQTLRPPQQRLDAAGCRDAYPFFDFGGELDAWDESGAAGYINPRTLIAAQLKIAAQNGAQVIREIAAEVLCRSGNVEIRTRSGQRLLAQRALIAAGGYTNTLLDKKLQLTTKSHTILLAEIPPAEAQRLRSMPALISKFDDPARPTVYMLPPIPYPDGRTYIKLGLGGHQEPLLDARRDDRALLSWFRGDGSPAAAAQLKDALHRLLPQLRVRAYHSVPCLITYTAHSRPYIDALEAGRLYVCSGGNGGAAKSSDEIGRLAARLCAGDEWGSDLARANFGAAYASFG